MALCVFVSLNVIQSIWYILTSSVIFCCHLSPFNISGKFDVSEFLTVSLMTGPFFLMSSTSPGVVHSHAPPHSTATAMTKLKMHWQSWRQGLPPKEAPKGGGMSIKRVRDGLSCPSLRNGFFSFWLHFTSFTICLWPYHFHNTLNPPKMH